MNLAPTQLETAVRQAVQSVRILDLHTHIFPPTFGDLMLWGIDDLLTYHYLIAEVFRLAPPTLTYDVFFAMPKTDQADLIWKHLFVDRLPISEACAGVITTLSRLGIDPNERNLNVIRNAFASRTPEQHVDAVFDAAGVHTVIMTNNPFDPREQKCWQSGRPSDPRFQAALRIDDLLLGLPHMAAELNRRGYKVAADLSGRTCTEIRRFLNDCIDRMDPWYVAASVTPDFDYPGDDLNHRLLDDAILPTCRERNLAMALMAGVRRQINPRLRLAGDGVGRCDASFVARLCDAHPDNRFLITMLSRENQHELCVIARKFRNLHLFGCWWFLNNPSIIHEITAERMETLGLSFTPQHSDARVLDQIIYKWTHSRRIIADGLIDRCRCLADAGYHPSDQEIRATVEALFGGSFRAFLGRA